MDDGESATAAELLRALEDASAALLRAQCLSLGWERASGMALDDIRATIDATRKDTSQIWCEVRSLLDKCERESASTG